MDSVYRKHSRSEISENRNERRALRDDAADALCRDAVMPKSCERRISSFGRDGDEQAAGSLRVEQEILILGSYSFVEYGTIANESAVILEAARKMPLTSGFHSAGKINKRRVIDLQRDGRNALSPIAQRHFSRVTQ